jgi:hypothetical protein
MAKTTIGEAISSVRNQIKAVRQDAFLTDRFLYNLFLKHSKLLIKREDGKNKMLSFASAIQSLDYVELKEVDKIEASCAAINSHCKIKRTKDKLPVFMQGYYGPLIRAITSLDGSEEIQQTIPGKYLRLSNSKNFKYNKTKYYWYLNEYLYFPDLDWDAVRIEGIFEDDISMFTCAEDQCIVRTSQNINVPDYLYSEIEAMTIKDLLIMYQIPSDHSIDKQSLTR